MIDSDEYSLYLEIARMATFPKNMFFIKIELNKYGTIKQFITITEHSIQICYNKNIELNNNNLLFDRPIPFKHQKRI